MHSRSTRRQAVAGEVPVRIGHNREWKHRHRAAVGTFASTELREPIPDLGRPYDELWWLRQLLKREDLSFLPPALELRLDVESTLARIGRQRSESGVRRVVAELNARIRKINATTTTGPGSNVVPLDPDEVVRRWRGPRS